MTRPDPADYASYFKQYVDQVPDGDLAATYESQFAETLATLSDLDDDRWTARYEPGKWSVKELVGHIIDTERIMSTRALVFARNESQEYPGFEQNDFVAATNLDGRSSTSLLEEWKGLRAANLALMGSLSDEELDRSGVVEGNRMTPRALFWVLAGHERHHMRVLRDRYLS